MTYSQWTCLLLIINQFIPRHSFIKWPELRVFLCGEHVDCWVPVKPPILEFYCYKRADRVMQLLVGLVQTYMGSIVICSPNFPFNSVLDTCYTNFSPNQSIYLFYSIVLALCPFDARDNNKKIFTIFFPRFSASNMLNSSFKSMHGTKETTLVFFSTSCF